MVFLEKLTDPIELQDGNRIIYYGMAKDRYDGTGILLQM